MALTRRQVLGAAAAAGAATLVPTAARAAAPRGWLDWIAAHRGQVAALADTGAGTLAHREHVPHLLASTVKVVHLAAYATAVAEGRLDPAEPVRLGDWDNHYPYVGDGGAHLQALTALGIPYGDLGTALDPDRTVSLDTLAAAMIDFSDNAAPDYLRRRLGESALHRAAARGGWHRPDTRSFQGEILQLVLPELAAPAGAPAALRRRVGDRLALRFIRDQAFRQHVVSRIPGMPKTPDEQWPSAREHAKGTAADLFALHRSIATGSYPVPGALPVLRGHLERSLAGKLPPGAVAVGFKGGSLPRTLNMAMTVRWRDGRTGVLVLLLHGVTEADMGNSAALGELCLEVLSRPERLADLARALGH
ncbi:serine hydrolase [Amycolatopsis suaedae]|uniref:Beta-lactamase n=1 Tax=Amycolatopsis suaedae TaxID=2510978 RepID=A0A4Q7IWY2_9PSEU|nr:serine hydrolase [Amycolatopsis suaedae]RZQ59430.1 hypothetical protein EWH70_34535 [Amycolatopsis suaedae]